MPLSPGTRIGSYEVLAKLGEGGMGEVYRARDSKLGRDVALKLLPDAFATDPDRLARFEREARTLASLNHSHIAQIYGFEDRALVMELVDGDDLAQRIARGPMPIDEALAIARQIAEALETAHDAGIIHRDLKPANIKVRGDGSVKVLDFGLAKAAAPIGSPAAADVLNSPTMTSPAMLTMGGVILGTAAYMAPEQAKGKPVDKRADVWAFGCVLYEMVTGRRPFEGEDVTDTIAAVVSKDPDWSRVPATLRRLLQHCLQKDPRRRLRDIGDAWHLLDDAVTPSRSTPAPRGRLVEILVGVAALAIVTASLLAYRQFRAPTPTPPPVTRLHMALPPGAAPDLNMQLSPDGHRMAYLGRGADGVIRVFVRALDELDARPLAGTEGVGSGSIFWSHDSRWLAFMSQFRLRKIDVIGGGSPQPIADTSGADVIGGAWNRDGMIVFGSNPGGRPGSGGLFKVSASGGSITPITALDVGRQEMGHRFPLFLPDGKRFLYLRASYDPEQSGIFAGDIDSPPARQPSARILATPAGPAMFVPSGGQATSAGRLLFFRSNALMLQPFDLQTLQVSGEPRTLAEPVGTFLDRAIFSATPTTLMYTTAAGALDVQLRWFDASGRPTGDPAGVPGTYSDLALSPDGTRAVVAASNLDRNTRRTLWMMDFTRNTRTRLTFNPGRDRSPLWSPDGTTVVYVSELADSTTIARKRASGEGNDEVLLKVANEALSPTSLSRDGRLMLFTVAKPGTRLDVFLLTLDGASKPVPLIATRLTESQGQLSPDGRWVAYVEHEVGAMPDVFVRPFALPGSASAMDTKWQISTDGGRFPRWLNDGRQLSYVTGTEDATRVVVVDVMGSSSTDGVGQPFRWGPARPLLSPPRSSTLFELTNDGKRILAATPVETNAAQRPLTVVLNWQSSVNR